MSFDIHLALVAGTDIPFPEGQISIHQPTIKEIALIGEMTYFTAAQTLCITKNMIDQGETLLADFNNFQVFMMVMWDKANRAKNIAVKELFPILVPNYSLALTPKSLILSKEGEESKIIDENNFDAFQAILRKVFCVDNGPSETQNFNPQGNKAREIAEKLMRARQRVAAQKSKENGGTIFGRYVSILTVGLNSMSIHDCLNLTSYQLFDLVERYMLYMNWDLDIKSRLAGGSPDSQPEDWMKNIH